MRTHGSDTVQGGRSSKRARTDGSSSISVFPSFFRAAMVVHPSAHVGSWEEAWDVIQQESGIKLFFDDERKRVVEPLCRKLDRLDRGALHGNGCCRLVLGTRGIGKTLLLRMLVAATVYKNDHTMGVFLGNPSLVLRHFTSPGEFYSAVVASCCPAGIPPDLADEEELNAWCEKKLCTRHRVFLVVDEVDDFFKDPRGLEWISSLRCIANADGERRIFLVVTGGSTLLRPLLYAVLPKEPERFPSYDGISCDDTKFRPVTLRRPQTIGAFRLALKLFSPDAMDEDQVTQLFIHCRGSLRDAQAELEDDGTQANAYVFEKVRANKTLRTLYTRLFTRIVSERTFYVVSDFGKTCTLDDMVASRGDGEWENPAPLSFLYQCADEGYIEMTPNGYSGDTELSFPHPAYYAMASSLDSKLTFEEVVALLYPFSRHGEVVERLVLESFAQANGHEWKSKVLKCTHAVVRRDDAVDLKDVIERDRVSAVYKVVNDCGVDGVALKKAGDGGIEIECIQVKMQGIDASSSRALWKRQETEPDASSVVRRPGSTVDDIVEKMTSLRGEIESYCGSDQPIRVTMCLLTNRDVSEPAKRYLAAENVRLVDRSGLYGMYIERVRAYVDRNRLAVHGYEFS